MYKVLNTEPGTTQQVHYNAASYCMRGTQRRDEKLSLCSKVATYSPGTLSELLNLTEPQFFLICKTGVIVGTTPEGCCEE